MIPLHAGVPDSRRAIGVARRAAEDAAPEHPPLHIPEALLHVPLIAGLADQHGHRRFRRVGRGDDRHGFRCHGNPLVMVSADHVEVDHRDVVLGNAPSLARVAGERVMVRIDAPEIGRHFGPWAMPRLCFFRNLTSQDPHHRIGAVARNQVAPVPLEVDSSEFLHAVAVASSPRTDNRRHDSGVREMLEPPVRIVKVLGIDHAHVLRQVRLSALILQTGREEVFVRIRSADNLHHGKAFGLAVGC